MKLLQEYEVDEIVEVLEAAHALVPDDPDLQYQIEGLIAMLRDTPADE